MDFNALWSRASAAASEVATAAQEQASRAAAAAQEQAELFQGSETFASLERALADIAANTVAVAEQSERNFQAMLADEADKSRARALAESAPQAFGVDEDLDLFLQGLTTETFIAFPLDAVSDAKVSDQKKVSDASTPPSTDATKDEHETENVTSPNVVSPWRETHARLALSKIPVLKTLYDQIVPDEMDDEGFWRAYFALCAPKLAKVEQRAAAAVARSRARRANARKAEEQARLLASTKESLSREDAKQTNESVQRTEAVSIETDRSPSAETRGMRAADAAAALAASFGNDDKEDAGDIDGASGGAIRGRAFGEEDETETPPGTPPGDLDAYLNDLLGASSDEDEADEDAEAVAT